MTSEPGHICSASDLLVFHEPTRCSHGMEIYECDKHKACIPQGEGEPPVYTSRGIELRILPPVHSSKISLEFEMISEMKDAPICKISDIKMQLIENRTQTQVTVSAECSSPTPADYICKFKISVKK
jgi:hypothetical protein